MQCRPCISYLYVWIYYQMSACFIFREQQKHWNNCGSRITRWNHTRLLSIYYPYCPQSFSHMCVKQILVRYDTLRHFKTGNKFDIPIPLTFQPGQIDKLKPIRNLACLHTLYMSHNLVIHILEVLQTSIMYICTKKCFPRYVHNIYPTGISDQVIVWKEIKY